MKAYKVFSRRVKAQIFFEKIETEADKKIKEVQLPEFSQLINILNL